MSDEQQLPTVQVKVEPESQAFWEGIANGRLVMSWCTPCDSQVWPPRALCPVCQTPVAGTRTLSGEGELYSYSIVHRGEGPFKDATPYVVGYVDTDGGPIMMANVINVPLDEVRIGMRLRLTNPNAETGTVGARFEPIA